MYVDSITIPKNYKYYSNELRDFYEATFTNYRHPGQEKQSNKDTTTF